MITSQYSSPQGASPEPRSYRLLDVLRSLEQEAHPAGMYAVIDDALSRRILFDRIAFGRLDQATRRITVEYERGVSLGFPARYETLPTYATSLFNTAVEHGKTVLHHVPDAGELRDGDAVRRKLGIRQALVSPITANGEVSGIILLNSLAPSGFTDSTITTVETFARVLGMALAARQSPSYGTGTMHASETLAITLARIALAETVDEVIDHLYHGIVTTTGASILRFSRSPEGAYAFEDARQGPDCHLDLWQTGRAIAGRLHGLIDANVAFGAIPQRAIFADRHSSDLDALAQLHDAGTLDKRLHGAVAAATPLHAARDVLGALVTVWPGPTVDTTLPDHIRTVFSFGDLAGPAIHRLILLQRLEQRVAEIDTIRRLTDSVARTPRYHDALDIICRTSHLITGFDFVAVLETATDHLTWRAVAGARDTSYLNQRHPARHRAIARIEQSDEEVIIPDVHRDPEFTPELMPVHRAEGLRSTALIPVYVNARLRAAMVFASRQLHTYTESELAVLHSLAATVATAIASDDARLRQTSNT